MNKNSYIYILFWMIFIFFISCNSENIRKQNSNFIYPNLKEIILKDIQQNTVENTKEEKIITVNNKIEKKIMADVNWANELKILIDCDINKPAWKGKYNRCISNDSTKYEYIANDNKLPIKRLIVFYTQKNDSVQQIIIEKKMNTFLFSTQQIIHYFPTKGFNLTASNKAFGFNKFQLNITTNWIKK